jgi:hypothetical protein
MVRVKSFFFTVAYPKQRVGTLYSNTCLPVEMSVIRKTFLSCFMLYAVDLLKGTNTLSFVAYAQPGKM